MQLDSLDVSRYYLEVDAERRRLSLLNALDFAWPYPLDLNATAMAHYVAQLKAYLQSVYDADLMGDAVLQARGGARGGWACECGYGYGGGGALNGWDRPGEPCRGCMGMCCQRPPA